MSLRHTINSSLKQLPRRSFWEGVASILDISGGYSLKKEYRYRISPRKKVRFRDDAAAIYSDWAAIGNDLRKVLVENKDNKL